MTKNSSTSVLERKRVPSLIGLTPLAQAGKYNENFVPTFAIVIPLKYDRHVFL